MDEEEKIASRNEGVLTSLIGSTLLEAVRYSWLLGKDATETYGLKEPEVFSLTAGPLAVTFDSGLTIGLASQPSLASVTVWSETDKFGEPLSADADLHPISANDPKFSNLFWRDMIGCKINRIAVITRAYESVLYEHLPCEVGLYFGLSSGNNFIAAHGLHDDSDDFSVVSDENILVSIRNNLTYRTIAAVHDVRD